jgi:hypothetical protein
MGVACRSVPEDAVSYRIEQMRAAFPDAEVTGYESLIDGRTNHDKDRHAGHGLARVSKDLEAPL